MSKLLPLFLFGILTIQSPAYGSCLDEAAKFAERVCGDIAREGSNSSVSGKAEAQAKADSILSRIIGSGSASLSAEALKETYTGVVREQLASDRFNVINCRMEMVNKAIKELCKDSSSSERAAVGSNYLQNLVGRWSRDSDGEMIQITRDGDLIDSKQGQGRISSTVEAGANFAVHFHAFSCFYYVTFLTNHSMVFARRRGGKSCESDKFVRIAD
ncbi:hypothetical protein [Methylobacterium oryzae]|uniref:hypothetical protein n=1 Tax=Methylobacterium oryzae TaxID=334852 RepID=UPI001F3F3856|nr:hypothetical protein [Methylobacterium oryzae]UIN38465.1 hypothetical protein LXM90_31490 [Methylobacterium oryzae]